MMSLIWTPSRAKPKTSTSSAVPLQTPLSVTDQDQDAAIDESRPRRIGIWGWVFIVGSFVILLATVGFLSWVWCQTDLDNAQWKRAVLSPYAMQTVTLTALLIRTAMGILAGMATSMIAAIAIERQGVPLIDVAQVSLARFSNSPPVTPFFWMFGPALTLPLRIAAGILVTTTVVSQLTSTLLVNDFSMGILKGFSQESNLNFPSLGSTYATGVSVWTQKVSTSLTFAEYSEEVDDVSQDMDDTGPSIRAFLPIPSQTDREKLYHFEGTAKIYDARVQCVRPEIHSLRFNTSTPNTLCFSIGLSRFPDTLQNRTETPDSHYPRGPFEFATPRSINLSVCCSVRETALLDFVPSAYHMWKLCQQLPGTEKYYNIRTQLAAYPNKAHETSNLVSGYLLWDLGRLSAQVRSVGPEGGNPVSDLWDDFAGGDTSIINTKPWNNLNSTSSGPWRETWFRVTQGVNGKWGGTTKGDKHNSSQESFEVGIKSTYCFDLFGAEEINVLNVTATRETTKQEPNFVWSEDLETYNAARVRHQLGAIPNSKASRATDGSVLTISTPALDSALEAMRKEYHEHYEYELENSFNSYRNYKYDLIESELWSILDEQPVLCPDCRSNTSPELSVLFHETLNETNSPALALQAMKTALASSIWNDKLPTYTKKESATLLYTREVLYPQSRRGFWAVIATIAVPSLLFLVLLYHFLNTDSSFLDNVWHTVAQISESEACVHILRGANLASDITVKAKARDIEASKAELTRQRSVQTITGRQWARLMRWPWHPNTRKTKTKMLRYTVDKGGMLQVKEVGTEQTRRRETYISVDVEERV
ncbi:hypothetical protein FSARC_254 [Fusarium sarcochroum]|uniref:Uncharacterized protein n=1 Tax=Fusarium sarcochroum TaxID=1208366 RepID=A0A8H4XGP0_9HYPO|nr:hypothetical protein FSARC_254 [Fusarium sarcochroum]